MIVYRKAEILDFEAIHRLNYETFVEEIPQHPPNPERRLVDRFHEENTYWIGEVNGEVVAMCALRGKRPFSLEQKGVRIPDGNWLEIRLLAVTKPYRRNRTFAGLMRAVIDDATERDVDGIVISGTTREQVLYHRFGFVPFADSIGPDEARYVPMMLTRSAFYESKSASILRPKSLLAGPVECSDRVRERLSMQPRPHRSAHIVQRRRDEYLTRCNKNWRNESDSLMSIRSLEAGRSLTMRSRLDWMDTASFSMRVNLENA